MYTLGLDNTFAQQLDGLFVAWTPPGYPGSTPVLLNQGLLEELGLSEAISPERWAALVSGADLPTDATPLAQAYAGHQFGGFSHTLGDGRAVLLGEVVDPRGGRWDIQLKGSGPTPFSRGGDGRATLRSVLREYLISEAMHRLGVPTTRALAAVKTPHSVLRQGPVPGGVLARVAASHIRVGTLQFFAARRDTDRLRRLVEYTLARHYPERVGTDEPALALLKAVGEAQGELVSRWMQVGFIHGVMNTDNFTLSGQTLDYGPCAFMDAYHLGTVFSQIDRGGRYAYGNQGNIGVWNMLRMGEALAPLLSDEEPLVQGAEVFARRYTESMQAGMAAKIGLTEARDGDDALVTDLLKAMGEASLDHTNTFRGLATSLRADEAPMGLQGWWARWRLRLGERPLEEVAAEMDQRNPLYIPRNHRVEAALDAADYGDMGPFLELHEVLERPFSVQEGRQEYAGPAPEDAPAFYTTCGT